MQENSHKKDRLLTLFLVLLGVGALFMGFSRLSNTVTGRVGADKNNQNINISEKKDNLEQIIRLQNQDTDKDGLSDYDEMNIYNTSIYLPDSDSDGYSDKQEIDTNNNPNCPAGQNCSPSKQKPGDEIQSSETDIFNDYLDIINSVTPTTDSDAEKILSGQASAEEVRKMLLGAGMSPEDLSKIPDEEIMKIYQELLGG